MLREKIILHFNGQPPLPLLLYSIVSFHLPLLVSDTQLLSAVPSLLMMIYVGLVCLIFCCWVNCEGGLFVEFFTKADLISSQSQLVLLFCFALLLFLTPFDLFCAM